MDNYELKKEFSGICFELEENIIREINRNCSDANLNNVIVNIEAECFGIMTDPEIKKTYQLLYVNRKPSLTGYLLQLTIDNRNRDSLVFMFSKYLSSKFDNLDLIDTFNTFQTQIRSRLEVDGYFTFTSQEIQKYKDKDGYFVAKGVRGFEVVNLIDKVEFFREYFGNRLNVNQMHGKNFIYLMLNKRNGLVKIGTSGRPLFREKTLQSQEPEIALLTCWEAPREIEAELHKKFKGKKKRGEWFDLKSQEMMEIRERMSNF